MSAFFVPEQTEGKTRPEQNTVGQGKEAGGGNARVWLSEGRDKHVGYDMDSLELVWPPILG